MSAARTEGLIVIHCEDCGGGEQAPVDLVDGGRFLPSVREAELDMALRHKRYFGHELRHPPLDEYGRFG
jgi:hypothetical protein